MNFFEKILHSLEGEMTRPGNYGWFHILSIAIVAAVTVFLCVKYRDTDDKRFRRIMLVCWLVMTVGEIVKQFLFTFEYDGSSPVWDYQWYAFPYQLCGTPLVVLPFVVFLKDGKMRDACITYMATFSLFGGLAVYFYPNDVFVETIAINIQTMVHHGLQVIMGIYIASRNRFKMGVKRYLGGVTVFVGLLLIAVAMNIGVYHIFVSKGIDETFNMFYISPYFECTLPVLSIIYPLVKYPVFLAIYVFGFMLIAAIIYYATKGIVRIVSKKKKDAAQE